MKYLERKADNMNSLAPIIIFVYNRLYATDEQLEKIKQVRELIKSKK